MDPLTLMVTALAAGAAAAGKTVVGEATKEAYQQFNANRP